MTEEEFQELLKEVWEERTPVERGDIPARPSDIPYESFEAYEAAVRGSEIYRALTATNPANARNLLRQSMRQGVDVVAGQRSTAVRTAEASLETQVEQGSVLTETFFEDQEPEPELTAAAIERRGAEVLEEANISLQDAAMMTGDELVEAGVGEEDLDPITAALEAAAAEGTLSRQTMQLYGIVSGEISDFVSEMQEEARAQGLGDFTTKDLVDALEFQNNPALNSLASQLAVGNTYDRMFVKLPNGNDFFVDGSDYREVLNVVGDSNADLLNIGIAAAVEHGIETDDGWKNFLLVALENQRQISQGGLAAITDDDLPLSRLTAGVEGPDARSLKQARMTAEAREYSQFLRKYNGVHALAMLAAGGRKDLADEAFQNGGLSAQGRQEASDFLDSLGNERELTFMNVNPGDKYWTQLTSGPTGGVGAEAGLSMLPNSEDSREAYRTLYRSFFMEDPDDAVLDGFAENVKSQYLEFDAASRQGTNIFRDEPARERELREALRSPEAMAMQQIRDNPQYDALYGNRGSLTENQYRTQFQNRIAGLGADVGASTGAIQAGMRTGRGATTTGRLLFSEEGQQAQGLQGRLALAANVIARNT